MLYVIIVERCVIERNAERERVDIEDMSVAIRKVVCN